MSLIRIAQHEVADIRLGFTSPLDPTVALEVSFVAPDGRHRRVPAFRSGEGWRVRYSSECVGTHRYQIDSEEASSGTVVVTPGNGQQSLQRQGPLRVAADRRHLEHTDRTPFFWLADTWWYGFTDRLSAVDFAALAAKRSHQGFSVIQIVAGLYPETEPFTPEARSTSGWAWHEDLSAPNAEWFDEADHRIRLLIEHDLVPCIVGSWAHYLDFMTVEQMVRHWREMIARWSAYPVVWCLAGEPPLMLPDDELVTPRDRRGAALTAAQTTESALASLVTHPDAALTEQLKSLNELARVVRDLDPFNRPLTIHSVPGVQPWHYLEDESLVDFWLLQTGHQGTHSAAPSVDAVHEALAHRPMKPVINGEACYEGIAGASWQDIQRFLFYSHLLSGTAGHSYGAHGVWAFNTAEVPGLYSGLAPMWTEATEFPGATQLGLGRRILADVAWHDLQPHPEWITPHQNAEDRLLPYAAGTPDGCRLIYFPGHAIVRNQFSLSMVRLHELGNHRWRGQLIDPITGKRQSDFIIEPEADGAAALRCGYRGMAPLPSWSDWLLILEPLPAGA